MAHNHLIRTFREPFLWYEEIRNTSEQHGVLYSTEYLGITYDVSRFIMTDLLPFEALIDTDHYYHHSENVDCF
jgi:hypothetical protein